MNASNTNALASQLANEVKIVGRVVHEKTNSPIPQVTIYLAGPANYQEISDENGRFNLSVKSGTYQIILSHIAYNRKEFELHLAADTVMQISLSPNGDLEEVLVQTDGNHSLEKHLLLGKVQLLTSEVKKIPVLFGEADALKSLQLLPGVSGGGDGSNQLFVRGGMGDQNLVLLDGVTIFNPAHLFGFFSTFNQDAINKIDLYKGNMPAEYGGRISSVIDVEMNPGDLNAKSLEGGIGLISSKLLLKTPIQQGKSSIMLSGRRTYADLFLKLSKDTSINQSRLYFYDLHVKNQWKINDRQELIISAYQGADQLGFSDVFDFAWGNKMLRAEWKVAMNDKWSVRTGINGSEYHYSIHTESTNIKYQIGSQIGQSTIRQDYVWKPSNSFEFKFGMLFSRIKLSPNQIDSDDKEAFSTIHVPVQKQHETTLYVSQEWQPSAHLSIGAGLRSSFLKGLAPTLEPRLSATFSFRPQSTIYASLNINSQFIHQLFSNTTHLPTDHWVLSDRDLKPQRALQGSLGYFKSWSGNAYSWSIETFFKRLYNQIEYKEGVSVQQITQIQQVITHGKGKAFGAEFQLKKSAGKWQGWVAYTWSKSTRQFDALNQGRSFHARQDRPHDLSIVTMYAIAPRWSVSGNFIYATGNAVSIPSSKYSIQGETVYYYAQRNAERMPSYHRFDLSLTYHQAMSNNKSSNWNIGFYNLYNRKNAFMLDFRESELDQGRTEIYRIALFGVVPSVSWNFKF